jgi:hypothetical protein
MDLPFKAMISLNFQLAYLKPQNKIIFFVFNSIFSAQIFPLAKLSEGVFQKRNVN